MMRLFLVPAVFSVLCVVSFAQESVFDSDTSSSAEVPLTLAINDVAEENGEQAKPLPAWTGWLGPERNGWVKNFQPPQAWPQELTKDWQIKVGTGYGSPLVVDHRVYQHARQGNEEVLWCLDLSTGKEIWRKSVETPFKIGGGGEKHGKGPKSNPIYADRKVFTLSITGVLTAWNAVTGEQIWQVDESPQFGKNQPYWGVSTSPIIDGNRIMVHFGTDETGYLTALDFETGKEIWKHGDDGTSYSSPVLVEIDGIRQVVEWNHRVIVGVESKTGKFLWEFPFPHVGSNQNMPTPIFHEGQILVGGENRGILKIEPKQEGSGEWTVEQKWFQERVALDMSTAVMNDGLLYGFSHYKRGQLFCLDPASGEILWTGPGRLGDNVMFLSIPGQIVALVDTGELILFEATGEEYKPLQTYQIAESETWAPPVVLKDGFLIKDHDTLTYWKF
ncbi:Pyrrolo-quinoline quinone [Planctomycetales bacterium 10988]|nr:Pyrrolo-quinoline quinone [Planctomycetales bacterium 10988]